MSRPDFSGKWVFNASKSLLQIKAPDAALFVIDHREPVLQIARTHIVGDKSDTFALDLTTDGKEVTLERGEVRLRARAYWDDDTLVFDTTLVGGGKAATNFVRYHLAAGLESFVAEERFRSKELSYDNTWIFDRA